MRRFLFFVGGEGLVVVLFCFGGLMGLCICVLGNVVLLIWMFFVNFFLKSFLGKFVLFVGFDGVKFWEFLLRRSCRSLVLLLRNCCCCEVGVGGGRGGGRGDFFFWGIGLLVYGCVVILLLLFFVCGGGSYFWFCCENFIFVFLDFYCFVSCGERG